MERIRRYFDRRCKKQSLNSAIFQVALFSFSFCLGIWMIIKYSCSGDKGGLYIGIAFAVVCFLNTVIGILSIHAVVRRIVSKPT